ncbi:hypothetical protein FBZ91_10759 [Nitrospirillum viridazoti]|uniref:Uncharacterized protein n=1 Tax=Nitrospirillum viridazoti CBAmc TaxID=1441467 RepID=A0A248JQC1_9PROT|nr:hypothetical protein Y958_08830 [Nitrospirillum amazonense CBAmc]TWB37746.1 hypothetical protein FBZ91_10759 [Nitrospirillum amazonense]
MYGARALSAGLFSLRNTKTIMRRMMVRMRLRPPEISGERSGPEIEEAKATDVAARRMREKK